MVSRRLSDLERRVAASLEELGVVVRRQAAEKAEITSVSRISTTVQKLTQTVSQYEKALQDVQANVGPSIVTMRDQVSKAVHAVRSVQDCVHSKLDRSLFDEFLGAKDSLESEVNVIEGNLRHELSLKLDRQEFVERQEEFKSREFIDTSDVLKAMRLDMAAKLSNLEFMIEQRPPRAEVSEVVMQCLANARRCSTRHGGQVYA